MSFIFQCGHDALLLTTRELILRQDGFRVLTGTGPGDVVRSLLPDKIDLLLLCHTLSEQELQDILAIVQELPNPPRVLTLVASTSESCACVAKNEIFSTFDGPGTFLAAVHRLLDNHGGRPQPHQQVYGADPCRDSQAQ